jgi:transposase
MNSESESSVPEPGYVALVAIDWGDQKHSWAAQAADSERVDRGEMEQSPEAIEDWLGQLRTRYGEGPLAIALEQSRGALVGLLSKYAHLHLYPIHSRSAANFRAALCPSGNKNDALDADLLLELLRHHRTRLRRLSPDTEATRRLQQLAEARRKLVNEKTGQSNRLTALLKIYFPQALTWFEKTDSPCLGALLARWPTLQDLQKARPQTLRTFLRQHHCRRPEWIEQFPQQIAQAVPALRDPAVQDPTVALVQVLLQLLKVLRQGIASLDGLLQRAAEEHPDFFIFDSLPGAGPVMAPRVLAAFGSQRERYRTAVEMQQYSGIAPVTESSGKSHWVHFRWACPKFLRQSFQEWAGHSLTQSVWARAYYEQQRARGSGHQAAVRALAFKWIRIVFRCWKDRVPYDESRYLEALRKRGSPLIRAIEAAASTASA